MYCEFYMPGYRFELFDTDRLAAANFLLASEEMVGLGTRGVVAYGLKAKVAAIAALSDYDFINRLTSECASNPGGIDVAERLRMSVDALDNPGQAQSYDDFCREKVRKAFPQFEKS